MLNEKPEKLYNDILEHYKNKSESLEKELNEFKSNQLSKINNINNLSNNYKS
jgi:hypothetical protein